jgi:hypothetical protein
MLLSIEDEDSIDRETNSAVSITTLPRRQSSRKSQITTSSSMVCVQSGRTSRTRRAASGHSKAKARPRSISMTCGFTA